MRKLLVLLAVAAVPPGFSVQMPPVPAGLVLVGPASGPAATPTFRALLPSDLPKVPAVAGPVGPMGPAGPPGVPGPPGKDARPMAGVRTADIRDFGALPDGASDCSVAIRRALDSLPAGRPGRVWIPSGNWVCRSPVAFDRDFTELVGESPVASTLSFSDYGPGIFVWPRAAMPAARRPDAFGTLDATACPAPGTRRGLSVEGNSWVVIPGLPPTTGRGDLWFDVPGLTLSFLLGGPPTGGALFGMGDAGDPSPWILDHYFEPGLGHRTFRLNFHTSGRGLQDGDPPRVFTFGDVDAIAGPCRVDLQVGFNRAGADGLCEARAWVDGVEVPVLRGYGTRLAKVAGTEPSFTPADGLRWRRNKLANFHLGNGSFADSVAQGNGGQYPLYGLSISSGAAFGSDDAGTQVRRDGGPVDDSYRYLGAGRDSDSLVARMSLDQRPETDGPVVRFNTGSRTGGVAAMGFVLSSPDRAVMATAFRNVDVRLLDNGGSAFLLGPVINCDLDHVSASGGSYGLSGLNVGASYDIVLRGNCSLMGTDAWLKFSDSILDIDSLGRNFVGNAGLRFSGCDVRCGPVRTGGYTNHPAATVEILDRTAYTSQYEFSYINVDHEGGDAEPAVYCRRGRTGTYLRLGTVYPGIRDGVAPAVALVDDMPPDANARGTCRIDGNVSGQPVVTSEGQWTVSRP